MMHDEIRAFTLKFNGITHKLITLVEVFPAFEPRKSKPLPLSRQFNAIWDTGATGCVISHKVVNAFDLTPIGRTKIQTAERTTESNLYLINFIWS